MTASSRSRCASASNTTEAYEVVYTASGQKALEALEGTEQRRITEKLERIARCELRHPSKWDFKRMDGRADGRFGVGDSLRVFADIDDRAGVIRIHHVGRRENLYA